MSVKAFSISTNMATNSFSTEDAEWSGHESDNSDKKNPLKQSDIKNFFKIVTKKRKRGRPLKPKNTDLSPNDNQQDLEPPERKRQKRDNVDWSTAMYWPFVKAALEFHQDNRNSTNIDRGIMSAEAECIPRSTIYSIENRVGDRAFTRKKCFKERDRCSLMLGINNWFKIRLRERDEITAEIRESQVQVNCKR